jgi:hypothetical protein
MKTKFFEERDCKPRRGEGRVICPRCGKLGVLVEYTTGNQSVNHKEKCDMEILGMCVLNITESCFFAKGTYPGSYVSDIKGSGAIKIK